MTSLETRSTISRSILRVLPLALALSAPVSEAALVLVPVGIGPAQETQQTTRRRVEDAVFNALDKNHDGYISPTEATALPELAQSYSLLDSNRDGRIDRVEFRVVMAAAFWAMANIKDTPVRVALSATPR